MGDKKYGNFLLNRKFLKSHKDSNLFNQRPVDKAKKDSSNSVSPNNVDLFLHSHKIEFSYILNDNSYKFEVESPLPDIFAKISGIRI